MNLGDNSFGLRGPARKACCVASTGPWSLVTDAQSLCLDNVPEGTLEHARRIVADTIGVIIAGVQCPEIGTLARDRNPLFPALAKEANLLVSGLPGATIVTVHSLDGDHMGRVNNPRGHHSNPASPDQLRDEFEMLTAGFDTELLYERLLKIDEVDDMATLFIGAA